MKTKEKLFCIHYVNLKGNGENAAIEAGYSAETASETAEKLTSRSDIRQLIVEYKKPQPDYPAYWDARRELA